MNGVPRLEHLNLNLLMALDALLDARSVTRAARRLGVTQPAMSRSLATLRLLFGDQLLVRAGNTMNPTTRAASMAPGLRRALGDLQRVVGEAPRFDPATATGEVSLALGEYLAAVLGPALIARLRSEAPGLHVRLDHLDASRVSAVVERVELAVGPAVTTSAEVASEPLADDPFACLVRADHPVVGKTMSLGRYASLDHVLISPTGRGRSRVDEALAERELQRRVAVRVASFVVAPSLVATSDLVLTAPQSLCRAAAGGLPVRMVRAPLPLAPLRLCTYWDARRTGEPAVAWLRQQMAHAAALLGN